MRQDIVEGVRWLWRHAAIRTLALVIFAFNITWGAAWSVLVLWSLHRVDMGAVGFGLLTTASAVGGIIGTSAYGWLERRFDHAVLMKTCLLLEVLMHGALALTTVPWVALVLMFGFGLYAIVWFNVSQTIQQRAVPTQFQGRVGSVYRIGVFGGLVIGQVIGGVVAQEWGLAARSGSPSSGRGSPWPWCDAVGARRRGPGAVMVLLDVLARVSAG